MSLVATNTGKTFTPAPAGTHVSICVQVIDLGTQTSKFYKVEKGPKKGEPQQAHKVLIGWELCNENNDDGEPFLLWKRYTLSLNEKATLRLHLESWRGKKFTAEELEGFHLKNIVGKPCMLNVVHTETDGNTYANVSGVVAVPKGMEVPSQFHEAVVFDIEEWDQGTFDSFNDNLKNTILESLEAKARMGVGKAQPAMTSKANEPLADDDIPF
jgi:hypothetical protein